MLGFTFQNKVVCCSIVTLTYMSLFFVSVGASGWLLSALRYWSEPMLGRGSSTDSVELPLSYVVRASALSSYPSYFLRSRSWRLFLPPIFPIVAFICTTLSLNFAFVRPFLLSFDEVLGE